MWRRRLGRLIVAPAEFFADTPGSLRQAAVVPLVLSVVSVASLLPTLVPVIRAHPDEVPSPVEVLSYAAGSTTVAVPGELAWVAAVLFGFPLLTAVVAPVLFHVLSLPLASRGTLPETARNVAWGFLPQVVASLVTLVAVFLVLPAGDVPSLAAITPPARTVVDADAHASFFLVTNGLGSLCVLWSGALWTLGLASARGTSRLRAAIVVVPITLLLFVASPPVSNLLFG